MNQSQNVSDSCGHWIDRERFMLCSISLVSHLIGKRFTDPHELANKARLIGRTNSKLHDGLQVLFKWSKVISLIYCFQFDSLDYILSQFY